MEATNKDGTPLALWVGGRGSAPFYSLCRSVVSVLLCGCRWLILNKALLPAMFRGYRPYDASHWRYVRGAHG